ncbi:hypothetical protein [Thalassobacillus pellis]|uniref:hypothetical protein n=1 Tax=Thalassobacillus pellis TaxID=748008 RepID=UPI00195FE6B2|nr:hypothetical protein [Thalassobacillus pellis]MBM7553650.1 peptidoglycan hydrolase CwlO-like protein [Thalassobacillus pellis]
MLKKSISVLLLSFIMALAFGPNVFASEVEDTEKAYQMIEETNAEIAEMIEIAQDVANELQQDYLEDMETIADETMAAQRTEQYNSELDVIINILYETTLQMTQDTIAEAEKLGVYAQCEWILVDIADRQVWIDPIRVVGS